ncbi:glycosyltransferase involved in cell wall biosynthesis [Marinobacterium mangrovicola]|uniref:Glycosyltransferase involved in cell wall biosynthesis n=2 Tax=Marinobacterium mangrovicola TaxID=1476959 RepID=A0A4R1GIW9_9GAMM|nr:glycosyltransferase involved in cell wall biosynthesis [Marinobacterium mangrovicola]
MPRVSIIMPVHNASEFIGYSIGSVLGQIYSDWELLLVDDASSDDSFDIAQSYRDHDSRINTYKLNEKSGPAVARNFAISKAVGRYIAFLDSDDSWSPKKLAIQLKFMEEKKVFFSYSDYQKIDRNGLDIGSVTTPPVVNYSRLLKGNVIGCLTAMYDTQYFSKVYMPEIFKRQDYGLWLKLLKMTDYAYGVQEPLAQYRVHDNSISANKLSAAHYTWKLYREVERLSLIKCSWYFSHYAVRGLLNNYR